MTAANGRDGSIMGTRNLILRRLSQDERRRFGRYSERITVGPYAILMDVDQTIDALYFPEDLLVRVRSSGEDTCADSGMIGREGMIGWSSLLGCNRSVNRIVADARGGDVVRIDLALFDEAGAASTTLRATILRFVQTMLLQLARQAETPAAGSLDRRLACWLLMRHDRSAGDELHLQHMEIAASVGSRRASITDAFHRLEGNRVIRCRRGRILIRDRVALEAVASESYGTPESLYRELIGPFGKTAGLKAANPSMSQPPRAFEIAA